MEKSAQRVPASFLMAAMVAMQGKYIRTKSMNPYATRGVKTGVPSGRTCSCKASISGSDDSSASGTW